MAKTTVKECLLWLILVFAGCLAVLAVYIAQFKNMNEINRLKFELKVQKQETFKYEKKFKHCKNQLGVFYKEEDLKNE